MISWSYSSLKQFKTCPKQYYEIRVAKNFKSKDNADSLYGKEVHAALEEYVRDGKPLAKNYEQFRKMVDPLLDIQGTKYCEFEMALDADLNPCDFKAENYWVRGIADLLIVDGEIAFIIDYKTGKPTYADPNQLKLMALMVFAKFPEVQRVKAGLMFITYNSFFPEEYTRKTSEQLWESFRSDLTRLNVAYDNSTWPANPTGLCKRYCPVSTCKYYGGL